MHGGSVMGFALSPAGERIPPYIFMPDGLMLRLHASAEAVLTDLARMMVDTHPLLVLPATVVGIVLDDDSYPTWCNSDDTIRAIDGLLDSRSPLADLLGAAPASLLVDLARQRWEGNAETAAICWLAHLRRLDRFINTAGWSVHGRNASGLVSPLAYENALVTLMKDSYDRAQRLGKSAIWLALLRSASVIVGRRLAYFGPAAAYTYSRLATWAAALGVADSIMVSDADNVCYPARLTLTAGSLALPLTITEDKAMVTLPFKRRLGATSVFNVPKPTERWFPSARIEDGKWQNLGKELSYRWRRSRSWWRRIGSYSPSSTEVII